MSSEHEVFSKIRELSTRMVNPRPQVNIQELASELDTQRDALMLQLRHLKKLRLISISELQGVSVRLTLLGSVCEQG